MVKTVKKKKLSYVSFATVRIVFHRYRGIEQSSRDAHYIAQEIDPLSLEKESVKIGTEVKISQKSGAVIR